MLDNIILDWMHVMDLGVLQYCLGNSLKYLFDSLGGVISRCATTLAAMVVMIKTASKNLDFPTPPLNKLTYSMIVGKGRKPKLRLKAAKNRMMVSLT